MITCININKRSMRKTYLEEINLKFELGYVYGLIGPNGSGKTALMKLIAGLHRPSAGEIKIFDQTVGCKTKEMVAFSPSDMYFYQWMSIKQCVQFYSDFYKDFNRLKCADYLKDLDLPLASKINQLSSGEISRLKIALTLSRNAKIIILDEPFIGLDPIAKEQCINWIMDMCTSNRLFIIASHLLDDLESVMDRIVVMKNGRVIVQDNLEHLNLTRIHNLKTFYKEVIK